SSERKSRRPRVPRKGRLQGGFLGVDRWGTCRRISNTKMKSASTFGRRKKTFKAKDNLALFLFMRPLFPPCVLGEGFYGVIAVPSRFQVPLVCDCFLRGDQNSFHIV
ncbi:hypothetical protein CEXT_134091, partial [Caerostris extrusa]